MYDTITWIIFNLLIIGTAIAFLWLAALFRDAQDECKRQEEALAIAFRQMGQPGLYQICDNTVKAMNDTLNNGKDGE